eukprot:m.134013 g.134013  ORF g.134013 m.134013 type:complete len:296 (+) comp16903_c0_seq2:266-1153(+)
MSSLETSTAASSIGSATSTAAASSSSTPTPASTRDSMLLEFEPYFQRYALLAELKLLDVPECRVPGLFVLPRDNNVYIWDAVMFIRAGLYNQAVLKFELIIPKDFPSVTPRVVFSTRVFHPQIDPASGEMDLRRHFPVWRASDHLWCVFAYIRRCFFKIDVTDAVNEEASRLWQQDKKMFELKIAGYLKDADTNTYANPGKCGIKFQRWDEEQHAAARDVMLQEAAGHSSRHQSFGLSWVRVTEQGEYQSLAEHLSGSKPRGTRPLEDLLRGLGINNDDQGDNDTAATDKTASLL